MNGTGRFRIGSNGRSTSDYPVNQGRRVIKVGGSAKAGIIVEPNAELGSRYQRNGEDYFNRSRVVWEDGSSTLERNYSLADFDGYYRKIASDAARLTESKNKLLAMERQLQGVTEHEGDSNGQEEEEAEERTQAKPVA